MEDCNDEEDEEEEKEDEAEKEDVDEEEKKRDALCRSLASVCFKRKIRKSARERERMKVYVCVRMRKTKSNVKRNIFPFFHFLSSLYLILFLLFFFYTCICSSLFPRFPSR